MEARHFSGVSVHTILKGIIDTVDHTHKVITRNSIAVGESNKKLEDTVRIFNVMLESSEDVIKVTKLLQEELKDIICIKDQLLHAMEQVEHTSQNSVKFTNEISVAIEDQAKEVQNILCNMKVVQNGMDCLSEVLNTSSTV